MDSTQTGRRAWIGTTHDQRLADSDLLGKMLESEGEGKGTGHG